MKLKVFEVLRVNKELKRKNLEEKINKEKMKKELRVIELSIDKVMNEIEDKLDEEGVINVEIEVDTRYLNEFLRIFDAKYSWKFHIIQTGENKFLISYKLITI